MRPTVGLMPGEHVLVRRAENGARRLRADVARPEIRVGADAGARAAGLERRPSVERRLARILSRIERVVALAADRVVVGRHRRRRARHPVGELGQPGLRDDDRAGVVQVLRERRVVRRNQVLERQRAAGRPHERRLDVVLQRDRDAVQRTANLSLRALAIALVGDLERLRVDRDRRVQRVLVQRDAHQILLDDLPRRDAAGLHRGLHLGNRRFDDGEGLVRASWPGGRRGPLLVCAELVSVNVATTTGAGGGQKGAFHRNLTNQWWRSTLMIIDLTPVACSRARPSDRRRHARTARPPGRPPRRATGRADCETSRCGR